MNYTELLKRKDDFLIYIDVEKNLSAHTQRAYHSDLEQFFSFWLMLNTKAKKEVVLRATVSQFLMSLYQDQHEKASIARKISCFNSFERYLKADGINLNLKLSRPRIDKKLPIYLSIEEIFYLLDSVSLHDLPTRFPYRDTAIFELIYATGIRCSELVNITMETIDIPHKAIRILGKGRKERIVLFGDKAADSLRSYIEKERIPTIDPTDSLFLNVRNYKLTPRSVQRIFEMFRKFLKIKKPISPHKIRHSFATHLLNQGVDLRIVQELLGHKTLSSTERYTHVTTKQLADMCDTLHPANYLKIKEKK
ncbi:MAG: site-specific tyrosine recombinase/integron integrase [Candidatus Babeliales bacterium]